MDPAVVLTGISILAFVVAAVLIPLGPRADVAAFVSSPLTRLWHVMLAFQVALWAASTYVVWPDLAEAWRVSPWPQLGVLLLVVVLIGVVSATPAVAKSTYTQGFAGATRLPGHDWKVRVLQLAGVAIACMHVFGMLSIGGRAAGVLAAGQSECAQQCIEAYRVLRAQLEMYVSFCGAIIAGALASTTALRKIVLSAKKEFPSELLIAYGAFFTLMLSAAYFPTWLRLNDIGEQLGSRSWLPEPTTIVEWKAWGEGKRALEEYLGLQRSPLDVFRSSISVLAPLLTGLSGALFKSKEDSEPDSEPGDRRGARPSSSLRGRRALRR